MDTPYPSSSAFGSETVNELIGLLVHEKYRLVIQYFQQTSESVTTLDTLVKYSVQRTDDDIARENRAIALHHVALPKLADAGVLDYDTRNNTVRYHGWPVAEQLVGRSRDQTGNRMTDDGHQNQKVQEAYKHLEDAVQADDLATKDYHIRESLQLLRIATGASTGETETDT